MSARTNGTLSRFARRQREPMVAITADEYDIGRRIQQGDELWRGDPTMELYWNPFTSQYQVIGLDGRGEPYIVLSADECDQRILIRLTESDWATGDRARQMIDAMVKAHEKHDNELDAATADFHGELAEKLQWGIRRAFAGHLGGKSHQYSMNTPGGN